MDGTSNFAHVCVKLYIDPLQQGPERIRDWGLSYFDLDKRKGAEVSLSARGTLELKQFTISLTHYRLRHWTDVGTRLVLLQTQGYWKYITALSYLAARYS